MAFKLLMLQNGTGYESYMATVRPAVIIIQFCVCYDQEYHGNWQGTLKQFSKIKSSCKYRIHMGKKCLRFVEGMLYIRQQPSIFFSTFFNSASTCCVKNGYYTGRRVPVIYQGFIFFPSNEAPVACLIYRRYQPSQQDHKSANTHSHTLNDDCLNFC